MGTTPREILTVHELVHGSGLDVRLAGGAAGLQRRIEAVHISENEDVVRWIARGTLLLTTGVRLKSSNQAGVRLLRELRRTGMAGLLIGTEPHLKTVPRVMVEEADRIRLPLLYTPADMPLRAITSYINDALASHEMHRLRRNLSLQNELVGLLGKEQGTQKLACRLSALLEGGIVLLGSSGRVEASSGLDRFSITADNVQEELAKFLAVRDRQSSDPLNLKGHLLTFRVICNDDALQAVLAVVHQDGSESIPEFEADTLAFAERLLRAFLQSSHLMTASSRAARSRLLEDVIRGCDMPENADDLLTSQGISLQAMSRIGIVRPSTSRDGAQQEAATGCEASFLAYVEHLRVPCLTSTVEGSLVFLASLDNTSPGFDERAFYAGLSAWMARDLVDDTCVIGLSEPIKDWGRLAALYSQALRAVARSSSRPRPTGVYFHEDSGLAAAVLDALPDEPLAALKVRVVDPLVSHDEHNRSHLCETLTTYLACDRSLSRTTEKLCLHRNSLRYRLMQIERILGLSLDSVDDSVDIYLAVRANEVLTARRRSDTGS